MHISTLISFGNASKGIKNFGISFLMLALVVFQLNAQVLVAEKSKLTSMYLSDEMKLTEFTSIVQDHKGFVWFGTWKGLYRYDGVNLTNFTLANYGLIGFKITKLFIDSKDRVWIGTYNEGISIYDNSTGKINHIDTINHTETGFVNAFFEDVDHTIWIGSTNGLFSIQKNLEQSRHYPLMMKGKKQNAPPYKCVVSSIYFDQNKQGWLGTYTGLVRFDQTKNLQDLIFRDKIFDYVTTLLPQGDTLWVGSKMGLFRVNTKKSVQYGAVSSFDGKYISSVKQSTLKPTEYHIGTMDGLYQFNLQTNASKLIPLGNQNSGTKPYSVVSFFEDKKGVILVGTDQGPYRLDPYQTNLFNVYDESLLKSVKSFAADSKTLFLASWGGGLFCIGLDEFESKNFKKINFADPQDKEYCSNIYCMAYDKNSNIWVGTKGAGLYRLSFTKGGNVPSKIEKYNLTNTKGIDDDYIISLTVDEQGNVWAGGWNGCLYRYIAHENRFVKVANERGMVDFNSFPVNKILVQKDGTILLGTYGGGLLSLKFRVGDYKMAVVSTVPLQDDKRVRTNSFISDLAMDLEGRVYITTDYELILFNPLSGAKHHFNTRNGIPGNVIHTVACDEAGSVWVGTDAGLSRLFVRHDSLQGVQNFTFRDGLYYSSFNARAALRVSSNRLVFGGMYGFTVVNTDLKSEYQSEHEAIITNFRLFNEVISPNSTYNGNQILNTPIYNASQIKLKYNENYLTFEFASMNYTISIDNKFAYKMQGLEKEWSYTDEKNPVAVYKNLPPGKYTLLVKHINMRSAGKEKITQLQITIAPPWWKSIPMYIVYSFLLTLMLYAGLIFIRYKHSLEIKHLEYKKDIELYGLKLKFFTNISHEFRTPLTIISGIAHQLLRKESDFASRQDHYLRIDRNARILKRLIDDIMDHRSIENESLKLKKEQIEAIPFIENLVSNFKVLFAQKSLAFEMVNKIDSPVTIKADHQRMESIVYNLFSNACKFSLQGGTITCSLMLENRKATAKSPFKWLSKNDKELTYFVISIKDTGVGIAKEEVKRIFDSYYTGNNYEKGSSEQTGTGIGLPLVKKLVELHQGFIEVESKENQGSEFKVYIPLSDPNEPISTSSTVNEQAAYLPISFEPDGAKNKTKTVAGKQLILVVDDNDDLRALIRSCLADQYEIVEAKDGDEGLEMAHKYIPDLILLDVLMPKMTGTELCRKLKETDKTDHIPIIMLTALQTNEDKMAGLRAGADSYISKPFYPEHLLIRVEKLIESRLILKKKYVRNMMVEPSKQQNDETVSPTEIFLAKVKKIIEDNVSNPDFNVPELAQAIGMSQMQLFRKLKTTVDISANRMIRQIRLHKAKALLDKGNMNVSEVTYAVGFNDLRYFRNCFKEEFGINPSEV